jgi:hypothetical protein
MTASSGSAEAPFGPQNQTGRPAVWRPSLREVLAGIVVLVFTPALSAGFVYDSRLQILTGEFIHDPWNWLNVLTFRVLGMDVLDFNRPVQLASLMLDAAVWGREPFGYHLTSVLLHAGNTVLLYGVLRSLLTRGGEVEGPGGIAGNIDCMLAAVLFAIHPVVVEAVCEPAFREDVLALLFSLAAVLLALRYEPAAGAGDGWRAVGCAACCFLAVASKETGAAAPLLVGLAWLLFRRDEPSGFWRMAIGGGAVAVAVFLAARFILEPTQSVIFSVKPQYPGGSLAAAMLIQPRICALYVQLLLFPVNLCADYGIHSVRHLGLAASCVLLAAVAAAATWAASRDRRLLFAFAVILLPLLPVANLIPIYRAAADRYLYFPMAGVALAAGFLLDSAWLRARPRARRATLIGCQTTLVLLGFACMERQKVWGDSLSLWEDAYRKNPPAFSAAAGLGEALYAAGRLTEAEAVTREAIRLSGGSRGDIWSTLALILDDQGRAAEAAEAIDKAIEIDPRQADPDGRVAVLALERDTADAMKKLLGRLGRGKPSAAP